MPRARRAGPGTGTFSASATLGQIPPGGAPGGILAGRPPLETCIAQCYSRQAMACA